MIPYRLGAAVLAALLIFVPATLLADEEETGWKHATELSLVATDGNAEATTLGLRHSSERRGPKGRLIFEASGLRAESATIDRFAIGTPDDFDVVQISTSELTAESYLVRGRYERTIHERLFWFAGAGWERNRFAGVDSRSSVVGGIGHVWFETDTSHLKTDYALTATRQEDVTGMSDSFAGVRVTVDHSGHLSETTTWGTVLILDGNLDDTSDFRADLTESLAVAISERLALKVSVQALFDNQPSLGAVTLVLPSGEPAGTVLAPVDDLDLVFKTALVVSF